MEMSFRIFARNFQFLDRIFLNGGNRRIFLRSIDGNFQFLDRDPILFSKYILSNGRNRKREIFIIFEYLREISNSLIAIFSFEMHSFEWNKSEMEDIFEYLREISNSLICHIFSRNAFERMEQIQRMEDISIKISFRIFAKFPNAFFRMEEIERG